MKSFLKKIGHWTILLLLTDLTFIFMTWLLNPAALKKVGIFLFLFTVFIISAGFFLERKSHQKAVNAMQNFLENPSEATKQQFIEMTDVSCHTAINVLYNRLNNQSAMINEEQLALQNYQEYIEAWTHEIKTPLSLATLVLDNHKDEMSSYVYSRMSYVRQQISEDVDRILYYARLQADHVDYEFTQLRLDTCLQEVVADFHALAVEKNVSFDLSLLPLEVTSDKRVLRFMLCQLISNAVKYAAHDNGVINISIRQVEGNDARTHLSIQDNGIGVPPEDAPFIFDKGFTGNYPNRQNATGMGLYLVKKYAEAMNLEVGILSASTSSSGFAIELVFPFVTKETFHSVSGK